MESDGTEQLFNIWISENIDIKDEKFNTRLKYGVYCQNTIYPEKQKTIFNNNGDIVQFD